MLDGDPAPPKKGGTVPIFGPCLLLRADSVWRSYCESPMVNVDELRFCACDDAAAAACYLLTVAATDCACAVRWCWTSCLLSDGVTIDDISVCVL